MKVYTKKGDKGTTNIADNKPFSKADIRIEALGQLDELNAFIGLILLKLPQDYATNLMNQLLQVQNTLSNISSVLAFVVNKPIITEKSLADLEEEIDNIEEILPKISQFTWQSNNEIAALLQVTRTICRRAERSLVKLNETVDLAPIILAYINRLSDWFFIRALEANHVNEIKTIK